MAGKVYYEEQYALNELGDDEFCWVGGMQDSLKKGEKYKLIIDTKDASSNVMIQAVRDTVLLDCMGRLTVNGIAEQDSALYMLQTYSPAPHSISSIWVLWVIIATILGVAVVLLIQEKRKIAGIVSLTKDIIKNICDRKYNNIEMWTEHEKR